MLRILPISCLLFALSGCPSAALLPARPLDASELVFTASAEGLSNRLGGTASATVGLGGVGDAGGFASIGLTGPSVGAAARVYFWDYALRLRLLQEGFDASADEPLFDLGRDRRYLGQVELMSTPRRSPFYHSVLMSVGTDPVPGFGWSIGDAGPSVGFSFSSGLLLAVSDSIAFQAEMMVSPPHANRGGIPGSEADFWSGQVRVGLVYSVRPGQVAPPSRP